MKKTENTPNGTDDISRKEAIKKMGKYAALTAMGTFMILSPKKAQGIFSTLKSSRVWWWLKQRLKDQKMNCKNAI